MSEHPYRFRVVLVSPLPPPHGGIATWTKLILDWFRESAALELIVVDTAVRWRAVTKISVIARTFGGMYQAGRDIGRVYMAVRKYSPNIVHLCTSAGPSLIRDMVILKMAAMVRVPAIVHFRMGRIPNLSTSSTYEWYLLKRVVRSASAVLVLDARSHCALRSIRGSPSVTTVSNMVDLKSIDEIRCRHTRVERQDRGELTIIYVGHVLRKKGIRELVEAITLLKREGIVLRMVGPIEASFRAELSTVAGRARERISLKFHGSVNHEEVLKQLADADVFVLPSYSEGAPNSILEAMASELAIVATAVGAIPEILDIGGSQECGICVPPKDALALSKSIETLMQDGEYRRTLGSRARKRVEEHFSTVVVCSEILRVWSSAANQI